METTKHGRDQNIVVVSDISEPNSSASIAKKASQNLFYTSAGTEQIFNSGAKLQTNQTTLKKTVTENNNAPIPLTKTEFPSKTASMNSG